MYEQYKLGVLQYHCYAGSPGAPFLGVGIGGIQNGCNHKGRIEEHCIHKVGRAHYQHEDKAEGHRDDGADQLGDLPIDKPPYVI